MSWLVWLGLAVFLGVLAAVTGVKPVGTRHVAGTRLMGAARVVLFIVIVIVLYLAWRARTGT
jgi:hypothetical protein